MKNSHAQVLEKPNLTKTFTALFLILITLMTTQAQEKTLSLKTSTGEIKGVLLKPPTAKAVPVVLIIAGSGPTDKDGNQPGMETNSLKFLAESLKENGIASFRFDKRGVGASKAGLTKEEDIIFDDFADDVVGWVNLLAQDRNFSEIIIAGHSEGSLLGMIASNKTNKVKKFISIAGAGMAADEILKMQLDSQPMEAKNVIFPMIDKLKKGEKITDVPPALNMLFRPSVQPYMISWFKYNPQEEIKKLKIPVLIIQGDKDFQVPVTQAELLRKALAGAEFKIIQNMNHPLKTTDTMDKTAQLKIYNEPNLPLNAEFTKEIITFIKQ